MVVIDEDGRITSFSAAAEVLFRYAEADVLNENVTILMLAAERASHDEHLATYRATGVRQISVGREP